jgi:hypothetical protein
MVVLIRPLPAMQQQSDRSILNDAVTVLRKEEPSWTFIGGVCSCPPLINEQESVSVARIEDRQGREIAGITVFQISSSEVASTWLKNFSSRQVAPDWTVAPYDVGAPAYISTYRNGERFEIHSGRGRFLLEVYGPSRQEIDRIAKYLLQVIKSDN